MAAVAPEPGALELQTLAEATPRDATPSAVAVEVPTLVANRVTIQKPAAGVKLGVALRGTPPVVETVRGWPMGRACGRATAC